MTPKGAKGTPKVSPKSTKIPQKIATSKKVEKGGGRGTKFWGQFGPIFGQKCVQKSMRKTMPKNTSKNLKIKQKTRHDPTPKNQDSQISSAKAVPPK